MTTMTVMLVDWRGNEVETRAVPTPLPGIVLATMPEEAVARRQCLPFHLIHVRSGGTLARMHHPEQAAAIVTAIQTRFGHVDFTAAATAMDAQIGDRIGEWVDLMESVAPQESRKYQLPVPLSHATR